MAYGLGAALGKIDDGQPTVGKPNGTRLISPEALGIRPPRGHAVVAHGHEGTAFDRLLAAVMKRCCKTAHSIGLRE